MTRVSSHLAPPGLLFKAGISGAARKYRDEARNRTSTLYVQASECLAIPACTRQQGAYVGRCAGVDTCKYRTTHARHGVLRTIEATECWCIGYTISRLLELQGTIRAHLGYCWTSQPTQVHLSLAPGCLLTVRLNVLPNLWRRAASSRLPDMRADTAYARRMRGRLRCSLLSPVDGQDAVSCLPYFLYASSSRDPPAT